jgi:hypothetical protein
MGLFSTSFIERSVFKASGGSDLAVQYIREIPDELPPARLFLDDIEELTLLANEIRGRKTYPLPPLKYVVNDKIQCDCIEDLRTLGTQASRFSIEGGVFSFTVARFRTSWRASPEDDNAQLATYGRILRIIQARELKWKTALRNVPFWIYYLLAGISGYFVTPYLLHHPHINPLLLLVLVVSLVTVALYKTSFEHSVVVFRSAHEAGGLKSLFAELRPYIIGAFIGGAFTALGQRVVKFLWP